MKYSTTVKHILVVSMLLIASCSSPTAILDMTPVDEQWQTIPTPITQRYPVIEHSYKQNVNAVTNTLQHKDIFSCTDESPSTISDNLPLIDVSFIEADINDALLELSLLTGISIITDDNIEGLVSINFSQKSLDQVITAIIAPGNFAYKKFDAFIFVGSQSPASSSFHLLSTTCRYKPVFLQPVQIVELLTPYHQQYVNYYEGHDNISIVAPDKIQIRIQNDIKMLDQAPDQILLEMSILEVSSEALDLLGVKWNRKIDTAKLFNNRNDQSMYRYYDPISATNSLAQALVDSVSALNSQDDAQIKATPSIVTLNGREANFSSTQTVWLPTFNNGSQNQREVSYGVQLRLVPYISPNNQVRLEIIQASVSDLSHNVDSEPRLISHGISTSVLMLDGETLILGGLLQKKQRQQKSYTTGASSIPVLGNLFRHRDKELINTEVLIVIRPKILDRGV